MFTGKDIPYVDENTETKKALIILTNKKLGILVVKNKNGKTLGIITDGQIRRSSQNNSVFQFLPVKKL